MTQALNVMPIPTWNKLRVNFSEKQLFEPEEKPQDFQNITKKVSGTIEQTKEDKEVFDQIDTGVGKVLTEFVERYKNDTNYLVVNGENNRLEFDYIFDKNSPVLIDDNQIRIKENSKLVMIQRYASNDEFACRHAGQTRIYMEDNSELQLVQVQLLNHETEHFSDIGIHLSKSAKASVIRVELGAASVVSGCVGTLQENKSEFRMESLYFGNESRILDFNDVARHIGRKTNSVIKAQGALFDNTKKVYRGTIDFKRGSQKSVGDESENTMVFSSNCVNKSAPLILCAEDDVEGHHAASIGRIDEGLMFYMQSRGFSKEEIRQMMIESNFAPIVTKIPNQEIRDEILAFISMIQ